VVHATWEAEIGKPRFEASLGKKSYPDLISKNKLAVGVHACNHTTQEAQ
jgi:hypothetical protein